MYNICKYIIAPRGVYTIDTKVASSHVAVNTMRSTNVCYILNIRVKTTVARFLPLVCSLHLTHWCYSCCLSYITYINHYVRSLQLSCDYGLQRCFHSTAWIDHLSILGFKEACWSCQHHLLRLINLSRCSWSYGLVTAWGKLSLFYQAGNLLFVKQLAPVLYSFQTQQRKLFLERMCCHFVCSSRYIQLTIHKFIFRLSW